MNPQRREPVPLIDEADDGFGNLLPGGNGHMARCWWFGHAYEKAKQFQAELIPGTDTYRQVCR